MALNVIKAISVMKQASTLLEKYTASGKLAEIEAEIAKGEALITELEADPDLTAFLKDVMSLIPTPPANP